MSSYDNNHDRLSLGQAALRGAVAGALGAVAMTAATQLESKALLPKGEKEKPIPEQVVEAVAAGGGLDLSDTQTKAAAAGAHLGYAALWGAVYGAVQSRLHPPDLLHGLILGGLTYAAGMPEWGLVPQLGVMPPPTQQSMEKAAVPIGAHLVYGVTTALAFDALS